MGGEKRRRDAEEGWMKGPLRVQEILKDITNEALRGCA